nr:GNAT family N-acetyltransferase [uncultured Carboxylicivirga sp.]
MQDFIIRDANKVDFRVIELICDQELGVNYFNSFKALLFSKNTVLRVVVKNTIVIGFCYSFISDYKGIRNGKLKTIAIKAKYKRKGVGKALLVDACDQLYHRGARIIEIIVWNHKEDFVMKKMLDNQNFQLRDIIKNYWTFDSIKNDYTCPVCGHPCRCSANIYLKIY